jgi:hypothetical protein
MTLRKAQRRVSTCRGNLLSRTRGVRGEPDNAEKRAAMIAARRDYESACDVLADAQDAAVASGELARWKLAR